MNWSWASPLVPRAGWLAAIAAVLLGTAPASGEESSSSLRYRRVFVPQEQLDEHVRGLLPLKRDEFERRVAEAAAAAGPQERAAEVRLEQAEYRARLVGEQLVDGRAELTVSLAGEQATLLALHPLNLALASAVWDGETDQPATVGQGPDGRLACLVPQSGRLHLEWSLRGSRQQQAIVLELKLPVAPINRLHLELPADCDLAAEPGMASVESAGNQGQRTWLVELGGQSQTTLRVSRISPSAAAPPVVLVREVGTYVVGQASIDLDVALELDVLHRPLQQLTLLVDESLQPTAIQQGQQQLDWTSLPVAKGQRRLLVDLPTPLLGDGHPVRITGTAPWPVQKDGRLPQVRLAEGTWQEGRTTITAAAALQLAATPHGGCRQTAYVPASVSRTTDQFQFQSFLPDAFVTIHPSAARPALVETSGLHLQFDSTQVAGTFVAELTAASGERFEIEGILPQRWVVDSVDVQPADFLEDRTLAPRGPGLQTLRLALRRPLLEGRHVASRHQGPLPPSTHRRTLARRLVPARAVARSPPGERFVSLRSLDPAMHIRLIGDEGVARLNPATLTPSQMRLFDAVPGPILFEQTHEAESLQALLEPTSPRFQAETLVQAFVERSQIRQRIRLRCQPEASAVSQVQVRVWPAGPPVRWQIVGEQSRELIARAVLGETAVADDALLQLDLPQAQSSTFEIVGELTQPLIRGVDRPGCFAGSSRTNGDGRGPCQQRPAAVDCDAGCPSLAAARFRTRPLQHPPRPVFVRAGAAGRGARCCAAPR